MPKSPGLWLLTKTSGQSAKQTLVCVEGWLLNCDCPVAILAFSTWLGLVKGKSWIPGYCFNWSTLFASL